jgi:C-terminal processing protease CtpA/Prc
MYRYDGKTFLLLRQPTYMVEDPKERIAWFKAVMDEYGSLADALVLDQTHNPGGSLEFAQDFVSLFAKENTRGLVNFLHADRAWLADLSESIADLKKNKQEASGMMDYSELGYKLVESAYDKGLQLTETPIPFGGLEHLKPADYTWKKPVLLLTDELAGSCGDIVPMLMKENKLATLFGERTMGLGGNVEPILTLGNSQIKVHLTRGFFVTFQPDGKYDLVNPTENNGVTPDIHYSHSVDDFRAGFVGYVKAFSNAAAALTAEPSASPSK